MNRRSFLGLTSCAGLAALAGCSGILGDDGGTGGAGSIQATTRWAVPATAPEEPPAGYELRSVRPADVLQAHGEIAPEDVADRLADRSILQRHLDLQDVEHFVEVDPTGRPNLDAYVVFEGEFATATVIEELEAAESVELQSAGSHGGYEIYETSPGFAVYAVGDGTVVEADWLRNGDTEPADLEAIVDVAGGEADGIPDQHDGLSAAAGRLEQTHHVGLRTEDPEQSTDPGRSQFAGVVASGDTAEIDGEEIAFRSVFAFESEGAREAAPIDRWIERSKRREPSADVTGDVHGRFVEMAATIPTSRLYG